MATTSCKQYVLNNVAPHVGAWIEIRCHRHKYLIALPSHPMWVRGLKFFVLVAVATVVDVAPHVGAWIEMMQSPRMTPTGGHVAPHVGAWIEMLPTSAMRWLPQAVAPHVGAWIEIVYPSTRPTYRTSRTPCGCVD